MAEEKPAEATAKEEEAPKEEKKEEKKIERKGKGVRTGRKHESKSPKDFYEVRGRTHACNPSAIVTEVTPYSKNTRTVTVIDTETGKSQVMTKQDFRRMNPWKK